MKLDKLYHKCGYPILVVRRPVGPAVETFFVDGDNAFLPSKDGAQKPNVVQRCPGCSGFIKMEKLVSAKPEPADENRASGYIAAPFARES